MACNLHIIHWSEQIQSSDHYESKKYLDLHLIVPWFITLELKGLEAAERVIGCIADSFDHLRRYSILSRSWLTSFASASYNTKNLSQMTAANECARAIALRSDQTITSNLVLEP